MWWGVEGDATLLQSSISTDRFAPGLYAQRTEDERAWTYLFAVFNAECVTRAAVEEAMVEFVLLGFPTHERFSLASDQGLVQIA